jgi:hypothetical protein
MKEDRTKGGMGQTWYGERERDDFKKKPTPLKEKRASSNLSSRLDYGYI